MKQLQSTIDGSFPFLVFTGDLVHLVQLLANNWAPAHPKDAATTLLTFAATRFRQTYPLCCPL